MGKFVPSNKLPDNFLISELKRFYKENGRIPKQKDFRHNSEYPSYDAFNDRFGWQNALKLVGLIESVLDINDRVNISINELIDLANKLQRCPTVLEYKSLNHRGLKRRALENRLSMKYNDICRKYLKEYDLNNDRDVSKETILNDIKNILDKNGKAMTFEEMKENGLVYSYNIMENKCNMTFLQIISYLGYEPVGSTTLTKTKEEMLDDFYNLFLKLKRVPYADDLNSNPNNISSYGTYVRYFDSIKNVCKLANIDYKKYYKAIGAGTICFDKNGELCRSIEECNISNFLIENNIKFEKETRYSEIIKGDRRKFDWKIYLNDNVYYVEYAGMYINEPRGKMDGDYKVKINKKINDLKLYGYYDKCLFIYPDDITTKTLQNIFEDFLGVKLKNIANTYIISSILYYTLSDKDLLERIMKYSNDKNVLPSSNLLSKKESGAYKEILKRHKTYENFGKTFGKLTIYQNKKLKKQSVKG